MDKELFDKLKENLHLPPNQYKELLATSVGGAIDNIEGTDGLYVEYLMKCFDIIEYQRILFENNVDLSEDTRPQRF